MSPETRLQCKTFFRRDLWFLLENKNEGLVGLDCDGYRDLV